MNFYDIAYIVVESGRGGNGLVHFRREKYVPRGGPDGGDGGDGGNVYIVGDSSLNSLLHFRKKRFFKAGDGGNGKPKKMRGKKGEDINIKVPIGTIIYNFETGEKLGEILYHNQKVLILNGGKGGRGNYHFASAENRAPQLAEEGEPSKKLKLKLELKTIADVGIVGFPNAGKSTLLNAITSSKSKIANYPFTTLFPNLGVIVDDYYNRIIVVDIPGLIENASKGKGLGISFLRHVERVRIILFLLDPTQGDILEQFSVLKQEILAYNPEILKKPYLLIANKIDIFDKSLIPDTIEGHKVIKISAKEKINLNELVKEIKLLYYEITSVKK